MNVFSRFGRHAEKLEMDFQLNLTGSKSARFRFVVLPKLPVGFVVEEEDCMVYAPEERAAEYRVREGMVIDASFGLCPPAAQDRLYLTMASSLPQFRALYDSLASVLVYNINPERIREEPFLRGGSMLRKDGAGAGSVLREVCDGRPDVKRRIDEYMRAILPALDQISVESLAELADRVGAPHAELFAEIEQFFLRFAIHADSRSVDFFGRNMSDGTLHAFGVLVALFQCCERSESTRIPLIGVEEPEATLHPAAAGVLFDALREASHFTQVLVTTHSPDLLDIKDVDADSLLIVDVVDGQSVIGPADEVSKSIMRDRLATAGELLRQNQLRPESQSPGPVGVETD